MFYGEDYDERLAKECDREWVGLEEFLTDSGMRFTGIQKDSVHYMKLLSLQQEDEALLMKRKRVAYYRSLLNLYRVLCVSQNSACQRVISGLVSVDHILAVLSSEKYGYLDKQLYLELFNELYANSAVGGALPDSVLPSILIWEGDQDSLKREENAETQDNKLFCIESQPYIVKLVSDWVTSWVNEDAVLRTEFNSGEEYNEALITSTDLILQQRVKLYDFALGSLVDLLHLIVTSNEELALYVFQQKSENEETWKQRVNYWVSLSSLIKVLTVRGFFSPLYNLDIDKVEEFNEKCVDLDSLNNYSEIFGIISGFIANIQGRSGACVIPIEDTEILSVMNNLVVNILNQISVNNHYILLEKKSLELLHQGFTPSMQNSLTDSLNLLKTELIKLLQVIHDTKQTDRIYQLWDKSFKVLYNEQFRDLEYDKFPMRNPIVEIYSQENSGELTEALFEPFAENINNQDFKLETSYQSTQLYKFGITLDEFKKQCNSNYELRQLVVRLFQSSNNEHQVLSKVLLDILLHNRPQLVIEATNMLQRMFSTRQDLYRICTGATLLLDDNYYKIYKLLNSHMSKLSKLTNNFRKLPKKPRDIIEFYQIFRAGNPLLNSESRASPGIIDLCYTGVELADIQYTVFRRNKISYNDTVQKSKFKRKTDNPLIQKNILKYKSLAKQVGLRKKELEHEDKEDSERTSMTKAAQSVKDLAVQLELGKDDIWAKNQELMKTVGLHTPVLKLLANIFGKHSKTRPSAKQEGRFCQLSMINACYEFLYYFIWGNDDNAYELTTQETVNMLFQQIDIGAHVVKLLVEVIADNDAANELVAEDTVRLIGRKLDQNVWNAWGNPSDNVDFMDLIRERINETASAEQSETGKLRETNPQYPVRFLELLKTFVKSEIGTKPSRQKQVTEVVMEIQQRHANLIESYLLKDPDGEYNLDYALDMFDQYKESVMKNDNDLAKVLYPKNIETEFNFHLQFIDLLGLCCRGNMVTTNYCRGLYDSTVPDMKPMVKTYVPLCIRAPFTRFIHGLYFSDPEHKFYKEDNEKQGIWDVLSYVEFKQVFVNISNDMCYLLNLFTEQKKIMEREGALYKSVLHILKKEETSIEMKESIDEARELKVFLELEQYGNYVFNVVMPFLTNLIQHDIEVYTNDEEIEFSEKVYLQENDISDFPWLDLGIECTRVLVHNYPMADLVRYLVYLVVKLASFEEVCYLENYRESIKEFLKGILVYINDHYDDENSILEIVPSSAQSMQGCIKITINSLEHVGSGIGIEDGNFDQEIVREGKKQYIIQEKALPKFFEAVNSISFGDPTEFTKALRTSLKDCTIQNEFSEYVELLLTNLTRYIRWQEGQKDPITFINELPNEISDKDEVKSRLDIRSNIEQTLLKEGEENHENSSPTERKSKANFEEKADEERINKHNFFPKFRSQQVYAEQDREISNPEHRLAFILYPQQRRAGLAVKSQGDESREFKRWTCFGASYIVSLIHILNDISIEGDSVADCFHFRAIQGLLVNYTGNARIIAINIPSLKSRQLALSDLGVVQMVMSVISKAKKPGRISDYLKIILPEVMKIGCDVLELGIIDIQDKFMTLYYAACETLGHNQDFLLAIKAIIKEVKHSAKSLNTPKGDPFLTRIVPHLLNFIQNLCEGHHRTVQEFLSVQPKVLFNVDIVTELANLLVTMTDKISKNIVFITNPYFIERIAPRLGTQMGKPRRLIAWHKQDCKLPSVGDTLLCSHILTTLSECIQGPCIKNQLILAMNRSCKHFTILLEFLGAFFYRKIERNRLDWCGHGLNMYIRYLETDAPIEDFEIMSMIQFVQLMSDLSIKSETEMRSRFFLLRHSGPDYFQLIDSFEKLEENILILYHSMLEGNQNSTCVLQSGERLESSLVSRIPEYICKSIESDLFIQNLHSYWNSGQLTKKSTILKEYKGGIIGRWLSWQRTKVFLYYSFLTLLADKSIRKSTVIRNKVENWEKYYGAIMTDLVGRIEVKNEINELEIVYFPMPLMIKLYWTSDIVKELRRDIIYSINRNTPEEKVMGFQDKSTDIIILMEYLNRINVIPDQYPITGSIFKFLANRRNLWKIILIVLTVILNILLVASLEDKNSSLEFTNDTVVSYITWIGYMHFIFSCLRLLSYILMNGVLTVKSQMKRNKK